jgi:hypothetical protein
MISAAPSVSRGRLPNAAAPSQEYTVTQVVRWSGPPAVIRVKTPAEVIVALPARLAPREALDLARLVLDHREYTQLCREVRGQPFRSRRRCRAAARPLATGWRQCGRLRRPASGRSIASGAGMSSTG